MKTKHIYLLFTGMLLLMSSCKNNLDITPTDQYSELVVWDSKANVKLYTNSFYAIAQDYGQYGLGSLGLYSSSGVSARLTDGLSDILKYSSDVPGSGTTNYVSSVAGQISPDQNALEVWTEAYIRIRRINEFLNGIDTYGTAFTEAEKNQFKAEVRFFRGYLYFMLTRLHGSVILRVDINSPAALARSSESQCWDLVAADFDFAAKYLPASWPTADLGRVTKGAAFAFKSRAMLYAQRWQDASSAADSVTSLGYGLMDNYADAFKGGHNRESIFEVDYLSPTLTHHFDEFYAPAGDIAGKGGQAGPTQELVDAYEMADGSAFDWSNGTEAAAPYDNREPRFYASILYNGAAWKGRTLETFVGGTDGFVTYGSVADPGYSVTGYYMRKLLDEDNTNFVEDHSDQPWVELRYAEVLLNQAEALIQLNKTADGMVKINLVRARVALPNAVAATKDDAMKILRHEKMIELAFEGHRYWDLRRWKLATTVLNGVKFHGMMIVNGTPSTYSVVECDDKNRYFPEKYYYFPIPTTEISNNVLCTQIENW